MILAEIYAGQLVSAVGILMLIYFGYTMCKIERRPTQEELAALDEWLWSRHEDKDE
jgi:hypothetical protein